MMMYHDHVYVYLKFCYLILLVKWNVILIVIVIHVHGIYMYTNTPWNMMLFTCTYIIYAIYMFREYTCSGNIHVCIKSDRILEHIQLLCVTRHFVCLHPENSYFHRFWWHFLLTNTLTIYISYIFLHFLTSVRSWWH